MLGTKIDLRNLFMCKLSSLFRAGCMITDCRRASEQLLKIGRVSHKDDLMGPNLLIGVGDNDVRQSLVIEEIGHVP